MTQCFSRHNVWNYQWTVYKVLFFLFWHLLLVRLSTKRRQNLRGVAWATRSRSCKSCRLCYRRALAGIWNRRSLARSVCMRAFVPCSRLLAGETHVHIKQFHWSSWYDWRWKNRAITRLSLPSAAAASCQQQYWLSLFMLPLKLCVNLTLLLTRQSKIQGRDDQSTDHWLGRGCLWRAWY